MGGDLRGTGGGAIGVTGGPRPEPFGLGWPNVISIVRLLLLPIIVLLLLRETDAADVAAASVFAVGAFTDRLDGYLARRFDQRTATGAWLDPLSDKIYVVVPAIALSMLGRFPWWVTVGVRRPGGRGDVCCAGGSTSRAACRCRRRGRRRLKTVVAAGGGRRCDAAAPRVARGRRDGADRSSSAALTIYTGAEYFLTTRHRAGGVDARGDRGGRAPSCCSGRS